MEIWATIFIVSVAVFAWSIFGPMPRLFSDKPLRADVTMVIDLIQADRDWERDHYAWYHPSGVCIWVANQDYGLGVVLGAQGRNDYSTATSPKEGAMKLDERHRKAIWAVVKSYQDGNRRAQENERATAVAKRIIEMYGT